MIVDPLDLLRSIDPLPHGSTAPPLERVLAQIDATDPPAGRRRERPHRSPWRAWMVPALGAAAAIAVVAVVIAVGIAHHRAEPAHRASPTTSTTPAVPLPSPQSLAPRGGMPGAVLISGAFATPSRQLITFSQCQPCYAGGEGRGTAHHDWMVTSTDGGATWTATRRSWYLMSAAWHGADAWGEGLLAQGANSGEVRYFVSHDGGASWSPATSSAPPPNYGGVAITGGKAWSLGSSCQAGGCTDVVLHGAAAGDHLSATVSQPPLDGSTNAEVFAGPPGIVYVASPMQPAALFESSDNGRSWTRLARPCPAHTTGMPAAGGAGSLWAACEASSGATVIRRSVDGGRNWQTLPGRLSEIAAFQPASPTVAWLLTMSGQLLRTADGGRTWTTVWDGGRPEPVRLAGRTPVLAVQSATAATVVAVVTRGRVDGHARVTDFIAYRTTDGGASWQPRVVRLPAR
ncbi:MAG TPA: hypothetical protein VHX62_19280 [Solirubrobacteraceae bacterium]|jgi:hypothetical protein|nr:hypothetical protein [Solirubrobacteraceae bacterium]